MLPPLLLVALITGASGAARAQAQGDVLAIDVMELRETPGAALRRIRPPAPYGRKPLPQLPPNAGERGIDWRSSSAELRDLRGAALADLGEALPPTDGLPGEDGGGVPELPEPREPADVEDDDNGSGDGGGHDRDGDGDGEDRGAGGHDREEREQRDRDDRDHDRDRDRDREEEEREDEERKEDKEDKEEREDG